MEANTKGSFYDRDGKCIFFSIEDFVKTIVATNNCFLCGVEQENADFNDEHILPNWLLKKFDLHNRYITIPNLSKIRYDQYKIPCCVSCNSFLGDQVETYMSNLCKGGHADIAKDLEGGNGWNLFIWLALIFVKTHLKDKNLRFHQDLREEDHKIGDLYEWETLHHIYTLGRSVYTKPSLEASVMGSILVLPALITDDEERFDFSDRYDHSAMMVRIDDVAIICVFNDACASLQFITKILDKIKGPLSILQIREIFAHMCFINSKLADRPKFLSQYDKNNDEYRIACQLPEKPPSLENYDQAEWGEHLYSFIERLESLRIENHNGDEINVEDIKSGNITFITDDNGEFIQH